MRISNRWMGAALLRGLAAAALAAVLAACTQGSSAPQLGPQDPGWSRIIHSHTAGLVPRKSTIRVMFSSDVVEAGQVGQSAAAHLSADPGVKGQATFASAREILLTPEKALEPGRNYRFSVKPAGLLGISDTLKAYEFVVQVQPRQFEVNVGGLSAEAKQPARMVLAGSLVTADAEAPEDVEKLLSAQFLDKSLPIAWQHNADQTHHDFSIVGIERQGENSELLLKWDGAALAVDSRGERRVEVPALNQFKVTQVQPVQSGGEQHVQIFFSDGLDTRQNLRGLIRLSSGNSTQRIEGNLIKVYPDKGIDGDLTVTVEAGIRNAGGERLARSSQHKLSFVSAKPQVRFVGKGVILPDNPVLSVPIETVNVRSVQVTAFRIYEDNVGQFLQVNKLDGERELGRVGRYLWRKRLHLSAPQANRWNRYALDVTELFRKHPGGMFRLVLSINRTDSTYACPDDGTQRETGMEPPLLSDEGQAQREASSWDYAEDYYDGEAQRNWKERENPCKPAYYQFTKSVREARNFLASNIGLLAKRDQHGRLLVVSTDLRTAQPLAGVKLTAMNYQNQPMETAATDGEGMANFRLAGVPFYLLADKDGQKGYLKVAQGVALPVSHFDVGGEKVKAGIKGQLYGERGVWRPGDDIFLTFVLQDADKSLPPNHPVTLELRNPKGQLVQTLTNAAPVGSFYKFALKTADDAPTGDWTAKAILGGNSFSRTLKIETVMPNRLKIDLDAGKGKLSGREPLRAKLSAQWLTGASAGGLKAEVKMRLVKTPTRFDRFADYVFDDPAREFKVEPQTIFEGTLDSAGNKSFEYAGTTEESAPGKLTAALTTRVFEPGGAFSIHRQQVPYSPYDRYVGIKLPQGDAARNMLLTDKKHQVAIARVAADGKPAAAGKVELTLYKVEWKWWWDKSGDSLAQYASASHASVVQKDTVTTRDGRGVWDFEIKYPQWGRYLVRACDVESGHCTGQTFYIDWPAWAGRAKEQSGPGASVLSFNADKEKYQVGDTAVIQLPEASQGRALVTVENGSRIVEARWIEMEKGKNRFELPITRDMSPNVYVGVSLVQPHAGKKNDRPIRLYGVIPLFVNDPETRLQPRITAPTEWKPESKATVEVAEASGREMTYTLAVVDEGLLGLTNFKTPALHDHFYQREALGVMTWDLFDDVAGAYGAELERLLALGGSDGAGAKPAQEDKKRFPPVVKFLGPFKLKSGDKARHEFQLPAYVGAVRVMVVAGEGKAYGSADQSVFVRQPLMLLPTLPRVVGPQEEVTVPVSIFVMDPSIKEVTLKLEADSHFELVGGDTVKIAFARPEEKLGLLKLKSAAQLGKGSLRFVASSGAHQARAEVHLEVRSPNPATVRVQRQVIEPGERWQTQVVPHGLPGTNVVTLEMSSVPPMDLERRLQYLIRYPHGCIEQLTSAAFPQLYLPALLKLEDERKKEIETNVSAAIHRLRGFQQPNGAFAYWPGGFGASSSFDTRNAWSTNYAGHFLLEAGKLGYSVPSTMRNGWLSFQKQAAQAWTAGSGTPVLDQTYRLYTLALAGQPEIGAMNRLRESNQLTLTSRWMLAASYQLAGLGDAAKSIVQNAALEFPSYAWPDATFGSRLRDAAIMLDSMTVLGRRDAARALVDEVSGQLASEAWHSTQSVAYGLMAMARYVGGGEAGDFSYERTVGGHSTRGKSGAPVQTTVLKGLPDAGAPVEIKNTSARVLFASVVVRGVPAAGDEDASEEGLALTVDYRDAEGNIVDLAQLRQGQDIVADIEVRNNASHRVDNIALTQMVAAGFEIHNDRMEGADTAGERAPKRRLLGFFFGGGEPAARSGQIEHLDIRDDRVLRYFGLKAGERIRFKVRLTAAYRGRFYQPGVSVEAMYDATQHARKKGRWVEVVPAR